MRPHLVEWLTPLLGHDVASAVAPGWFSMVGLAAIVTAAIAVRRARRRHLPVPIILRALLVGYAAAIVSGIVGPLLLDLAAQLARGNAPRLRWAGMTSWCGIAGGIFAMLLVVRRSDRLTLPAFFDCLALPAGAAVAVSRIGCFLAGCDYGTVTSSAVALRFPGGSPAHTAHVQAGLVPAIRGESLPVHASQLYEIAVGLAMIGAAWLVVRIARTRGRIPGAEVLAVTSVYAFGRFAVEATRGDVSRGVFAGLSMGQWMSLALLSGVVAIAVRIARSHGKPAAVVAAAIAMLVVTTTPSYADNADDSTTLDVSGMLTTSAPLNRTADQVPQLGGFSLAGSMALSPGLYLGGDFDSVANDVAIHRTLMLSAEVRRPLQPGLDFGLRGGIGFTSVDFTDGAFATVVATGVRFSATGRYWINDQWALTVWPIAFDIAGHPDIGGSIWAYQFRVGVTWGRRKTTPIQPPAVVGPPGSP